MSVTAGLNALVPGSDTFSDWLATTNNLSEYLRDHVMTASANTAEQSTNGDAVLVGDFQANTLIAYDGLRGGTLVTPATLIISSNTSAQANVTLISPARLTVQSGYFKAGNTLAQSTTYSSTLSSDTIDEWPYSESTGFKYFVQAKDAAGDTYVVEFLAVHDTANVVFTRYAELLTGGIEVDITPVFNGANVAIDVVSGANATNTYVYKIFKTAFV